MGVRVAFHGGRGFDNQAAVSVAIDHIENVLEEPIELYIVGDAEGLDTHVFRYCHDLGKDFVRLYAHWDEEGRGAGHIRNARMYKIVGLPTHAAFFPGGPGTAGALKLAMRLHVPHFCFNEYGNVVKLPSNVEGWVVNHITGLCTYKPHGGKNGNKGKSTHKKLTGSSGERLRPLRRFPAFKKARPSTRVHLLQTKSRKKLG